MIRYLSIVVMLGAHWACVPSGGRGDVDDRDASTQTDGAAGDADGSPGDRIDGSPGDDRDAAADADGGVDEDLDASPGDDMAPFEPVDGGPVADMYPPTTDERCNGRDDDGDDAVDEGDVCPPPQSVRLADPGDFVRLDSQLNEDSPMWQRFDAACGVRSAGDFPYKAWRVVNETGFDQTLSVTGAWGESDGFLHVFGDDFDPSSEDCLAGNDDDDGTATSRIDEVPIAADAALTVIASTYSPETWVPALTVEVHTAANREQRCDDGLDDDRDGATDCDDGDCAADAACDPCFGVMCAAGARCNGGECSDYATPIAAVGEAIAFDGSLRAGGPTFDRPTAACNATGQTVYFAPIPIVNRGPEPRMVQIDGRWSDVDGTLLVFAEPFDPRTAAGCIAGDEDFDGRRVGSRIERLRLEPGEVVVVVATTFGAETPMDRYEVTVTTLPDAADTELLCGDRVDEDRDGSIDCGDWDCAEAPECNPCADVACAAGLRCLDGVCGPVREPAPISIAREGQSLVIVGAITDADPRWARPGEDCAAGAEGGHHYQVVPLVNEIGGNALVSVTADWGAGDGFLHVFSEPFDPGDVAGCLAGNDDDGSTQRSRIDDVRMQWRGAGVVVVLSTYGVGQEIAQYTLRLTTEPIR